MMLLMQVNINSATKMEIYANQVNFFLTAGNNPPFFILFFE